jgi:hypothetical protein
MNIRTFLIGFSALLLALNAAYFSVTGLSMLFAGASLSVIIMAGSLEFSKLVAASFLYYYWNKLNGFIKTYFTIAITILVLITSLGIYGYLTSAYQKTADELMVMDTQIQSAELRKELFQSQLELARDEQSFINKTISDLSSGLSSGTTVQYIDQTTGQLLTTTSTSARRTLETQLNNASTQRDVISNRVIALSDSISSIDMSILDIRSNTKVAGEIGPLRFISEITGLEMISVVNILALLIVFVFDPLAITLVIAFNMGLKFNSEKKILDKIENKELEIYGDTPKKEEPIETVSEELITENVEELLGNIVQEGQDLGLYDMEYDDNHIPDIDIDTPIEQQPTNDSLVMTTDDIVKLLGIEDPKKKVDLIDPELQNLKPDLNKRGIDLDGDGTIDGYDTDGDGMIDEYHPPSASRWREIKHRNLKPYYANPNFDWGNKNNWINDQNAVNYWFKNIRNNYPTDFDSKTY